MQKQDSLERDGQRNREHSLIYLRYESALSPAAQDFYSKMVETTLNWSDAFRQAALGWVEAGVHNYHHDHYYYQNVCSVLWGVLFRECWFSIPSSHLFYHYINYFKK